MIYGFGKGEWVYDVVLDDGTIFRTKSDDKDYLKQRMQAARGGGASGWIYCAFDNGDTAQYRIECINALVIYRDAVKRL